MFYHEVIFENNLKKYILVNKIWSSNIKLLQQDFYSDLSYLKNITQFTVM